MSIGELSFVNFCYLTLDPNTTHRTLILSEKNRVVRESEREQKYSDHPERFDYYSQVLCKESVCGRCYWEVEWSGDGGVDISVSYKDISRKGRGDECGFGLNNQSWSLWCSSSSLSFYHNNIETDLRVPSPSRIGVYVDHSAGTLSFYSVSDTMKLLHRVHITFTQPLYAGFWPGKTCSLPLEVTLMEIVSKPYSEKVVELLDRFEMSEFFILVVERPDPCMDLYKFCKLSAGQLCEDMSQTIHAARHC
ncbi:hypothetical protein QTP70_000934 [Hemibagrus guttatus]|uniref:B30.2/SPRY domain-containing protein n=1 Tax=Hemibagrus guttatus TaxID=175788 RepID=A0AAE0PQM0_9TELE|nr:hypothetical protein QTP70_000934 [Hemibagrus guttatus]